MKKYFYSLFLLFFSFIAFSQNKPKVDYENWIVDLSQAQSSFEGIKIDKIELNDRFTVVHMSFQNNFLGTQHIEACNTFHIRSNGKKVARFVKAENIPTRYVEKTGFSCADETTAMRIKRGQFVRFRIFFTRIPQYLNRIDVIEYNGRASCEFDVWNLNISKKEPLPQPSIASATAKPKVAAAKPVNKNTTKPPVKKKDSDALIASKSPTSTTSTKPQSSEKTNTQPTTTPPEKREVEVVKEYSMNRQTLQLEIWDNDQVDGDMVSIMLNNRWILRGVKVTKTKKKLEIPLADGNNTLVLHADNLGTAPPNTAAVSFWDAEGLQTIILNSDMDNSQAIRFIKR
jgi:hypothetical protein